VKKASFPTLPEIDPAAALKLLMNMLPIAALSGKEANVASFITQQLRAAGAKGSAITTDNANTRSPLGGEIGNLIFTLPGTLPGPRRLLMAHIDTVPLCAGTKPVRKGGLIVSGNPQTGLGGDNRSGATAILYAATEILRRKLPHPPLTFLWPVQEEVGLYGARYVQISKLGAPKLCFNWDGNQPHRITIGATGGYVITIKIKGLASHAGVHPEQGVSAIAIAGIAIADLVANGWHGLILKNGIRGSSNFGTIHGGSAANVVPDELTIIAGARSHDRALRKKIVAAIRSAFQRAVKKVVSSDGKRGSLRFEPDLRYDSFKLPENSPPVAAAGRVISALGMKPELHVTNGGLDANWMSAHGMPTVTLGAGQMDVHTVAEKLDIASFTQGCRVALALATGA
jgi:tripeptide aminopeptidase